MSEYPSDAELEEISHTTVMNRSDCAALLQRVAELWIDYGRIDVEGDTYTLITGGWSGNEDLVAALQRNRVFQSLCWQSSHRGGTHVYQLPVA